MVIGDREQSGISNVFVVIKNGDQGLVVVKNGYHGLVTGNGCN